MTFWAHSDPSGLPPCDRNAKWQPLAEHLTNVSALARKLAGLARPHDEQFQELAACCGLLHDFGKYSDCFQKMILTGDKLTFQIRRESARIGVERIEVIKRWQRNSTG